MVEGDGKIESGPHIESGWRVVSPTADSHRYMENVDLRKIARPGEIKAIHECITELSSSVLYKYRDLYPSGFNNKSCVDFLVGSEQSYSAWHVVSAYPTSTYVV